MHSSVYEFEWDDLLSAVGGLVSGLHQDTDEVSVERSLAKVAFHLEFALGALFHEGERTRGFWCDGIEFDRWTVNSKEIEGSGLAWCGHSGQERMPIEVWLSRGPTDLSSIVELEVRIGDADAPAIGRKRGLHLSKPPTNWLAEFRVRRAPPVDPRKAVVQLEDLLRDELHARIVGPDWEELTVEEAQRLMASEGTQGQVAKLESTWLDGEPTVRVSWEER